MAETEEQRQARVIRELGEHEHLYVSFDKGSVKFTNSRPQSEPFLHLMNGPKTKAMLRTFSAEMLALSKFSLGLIELLTEVFPFDLDDVSLNDGAEEAIAQLRRQYAKYKRESMN